jgi:hypothetical protein
MKISSLTLLLLFLSNAMTAHAVAPSCNPHSTGNYILYQGTVKQAYINTSNVVLIYFENALPQGSECGFAIEVRDAGIYSIDENPTFGYMLYSTALTAVAEGKSVIMQMRGTASGYPKIDRIWIAK